jgi:arylsulfatase A-like enzyme
LLDFAGVTTPARVQGQSLRPVLTGQRQSIRDAFYYEHTHGHPKIAKSEGVRSRNWKLIEFTCGDEISRLFNLRNDPHEQRNLAADPAARPVLARLRRQLKVLRTQAT